MVFVLTNCFFLSISLRGQTGPEEALFIKSPEIKLEINKERAVQSSFLGLDTLISYWEVDRLISISQDIYDLGYNINIGVRNLRTDWEQAGSSGAQQTSLILYSLSLGAIFGLSVFDIIVPHYSGKKIWLSSFQLHLYPHLISVSGIREEIILCLRLDSKF